MYKRLMKYVAASVTHPGRDKEVIPNMVKSTLKVEKPVES